MNANALPKPQESGEYRLKEFCGLLKTLANPNRLLIVRMLFDGEQSVGSIETALGIRQPTLSNELGALRRRNLVQTRRDSRMIYYSLSKEVNRARLLNLLAEYDPSVGERHRECQSPTRTMLQGECGRFALVE